MGMNSNNVQINRAKPMKENNLYKTAIIIGCDKYISDDIWRSFFPSEECGVGLHKCRIILNKP